MILKQTKMLGALAALGLSTATSSGVLFTDITPSPMVPSSALTVAVTGSPGSDVTSWVFNGTLVAGGDLAFNSTTLSAGLNNWEDNANSTGGLDYTFIDNAYFLEGVAVGGSAVLNVGTGNVTLQFLGLYLDTDGTGDVDDFGLLHGNSGGSSPFTGNHAYSTGDVVTFTDYTVTHTGFDITDFEDAASRFIITNVGDTFTTSTNEPDGAGSLSMTFTATPEPTSASLLGLGGLAILARRKR